MKKTKVERKNVPEFTPPEPKFIELVHTKDESKYEQNLSTADEIENGFFHNAFSSYIYGINFPIESHLQRIGPNSFSCIIKGSNQYISHLYSIVFPPSLQIIDENSLGGCQYLNQISFLKDENGDNFLQIISNHAFSNTKIESIVIPENIKKIGSYIFPKTLRSIEFENGAPKLNNVNNYAFANTQIEKFSIPLNIDSFADSKNVFLNCNQLKSIVFDQALSKEEQPDDDETEEEEEITDLAKSYLLSQTKIENLEVFVSNINKFYFYNTPNLTTITIPKSDYSKYINLKGILYTKDKTKIIVAERNIKSATISSKCQVISNFAFNIPSLEKVTFENNSELKEISHFAFSSSQVKKVALPDTVKKLSAGSFYKCVKLDTINVPNSIRSIEYATFSYTNLSTITIPKNVKKIGYGCFYRCSKLNKVSFEEGSKLAEIETFAFAETNIASIVIPKSVKTIGDFCFINCSKLKSIKFEENSKLTRIGKECFRGTIITDVKLPTTVEYCHFSNTKVKTVSFDGGCGSLLKVSNFQFTQITEFCIPSSATCIGKCAFLECGNLSVVKVADIANSKLEIINRKAFLGCSSLKEFEIPKTVREFGSESFKDCTQLKSKISLNVPNKKVLVCKSAFENTGIISFESECHDVFLNDCAFQNCKQLKKVVLKVDRVCDLSSSVFMDCTSLSTFKTNKMNYIGDDCFNNTSIKEFDILEGLKDQIPDRCFKNCKKLVRVTIDESLSIKRFGKEAFYETGIKSIIIPSKVNEIGESCFENCKGLKEVTFTDSEDENLYCSLYEKSFCSSGIEKIHFPKGNWSLKYACFCNCTNLKSVTFSGKINNDHLEESVFESTSIENIEIPMFTDRNISWISEKYYYTNRNIAIVSKWCFKNCKLLKKISFQNNMIVFKQFAFEGCSNLQSIESPHYLKSEINDNGLFTSIVFEKKIDKKSIDVFVTNTEPSITYFQCFDFINSLLLKENLHLDLSLGFDEFNFQQHYYYSNKYLIDKVYDGFFYTHYENDKKNIKARTIEQQNGGYYRDSMKKLFFCDFSTEELNVSKDAEIIENEAFKYSNLKKIEFEKGSILNTIGCKVFEYLQLEEITIPDTVNVIGESAFRDCHNLKKVVINETSQLTTIEDAAFEKTAIETILFPSNLSKIGSYAFYECFKLKSIDNRSKEIEFGDNCFYRSSIEKIDFSPNTTFGFSSFKGCINLKKLTFIDNKPSKLFFDEESFAFSGLEELSLDCEVEIKQNAFIFCSFLKQISLKGKSINLLPSSFKYSNIESCILNTKCDLTSSDIINDVSLTPIEKVSFVLKSSGEGDSKPVTEKHFMNHKCYVIDYVLVYANLIDNFLLFEKSPPGKKVELKRNEVLRVPSNVKKLNFPPMTHIRKIQWASNCIVEDLGPSGSFSYYNLTEITIPKLVKMIPEFCFQHCHFLEVVIFEEDSKLEEVGDYSFSNTSIKKIDLPETVQIIGHYAFFNCHKLNEVSFHGKSIGLSAFERTNLISFDLSNNTEIISNSAFRHCRSLTKFTINIDNSNLFEIGSHAFCDTSIVEINIPPDVKTIHDYTFDGCEFLKEINFSKKSKLSKIEQFAFTGLVSLSRITIPQKLVKKFKKKIWHFLKKKSSTHKDELFETLNDRFLTFEDSELVSSEIDEDKIEKVCFVTTIKEDQNENLESNPNCFVENNCYVVSGELKYAHLFDNSLIYEKPTEQTKGKMRENEILRVPSNVKKLNLPPITHIKRILWGSNCIVDDLGGDFSFAYYNLQEITIPKLVKIIPAHCFDHCHNLRVVQFHKGSKLKEIGEYAFANTRIEKIEIPKTVQMISHFSFFNDLQLKEVSCDAKTIGEFAFAQSGLTTFVLPNKTKSIRYGAFQYCRSLTTFEIDIENSNLSIIRPYAFQETGITEINIPPKVKAIREFTFNGCQSLKEVIISQNSKLSIIEDHSFSACLSLTKINIPKTINNLASKAFINTPSLQMIMNKPNHIFRVMKNYTVYGKDGSLVFVPRELVKYKLMKNTFTIRSGAFCGPNIQKVSFADNSLVKIEECAFAHSTALKKIHLPNSLRIVGDEAFIDCQSLEKLDFEPTTKLKEIPSYCFAFSGLKSIKLPIGIEIIKNSSFYMCQNLKNINLADTNVKYIGDCAFSDANLSEIKLPKSIKFIGSNAFAGNKNIKLIDLTKLDIIVDTNQLPIISFIRKVTQTNDKLLNAIKEFSKKEFERRIALEQEQQQQKEQQQQQKQENIEEEESIENNDNRENSPSSNKKVPTISMNMLSKKNNPVIFKPNINSSRPTSSRIQSPRKNQAQTNNNNNPIPILPPPDGNQTKSPRKINKSPSNNENNNENNEQVVAAPVEETIEFNYKEEDEEEENENENKVTFIHELAFSSSQIKLFSFELDEYKWFSFFDYCSRIEQYQINKNFTLSLHKLIKEKPKEGNLTGQFFKIKKIDCQDSEDTLPMFLGSFKRRRMRTLTPFHFFSFTKLSYVTFDDSINISEIPKSLFAFSPLREITIPSSVNTINQSAFYSCRFLSKVIFSKESNLSEIKDFAFFDCRKLSSISLPASLKIIPRKCFDSSGLKSIKLPKSTESVGYMAFGNCYKLSKVVLNKGLKELGSFSFANNPLIESIDLPDSLEKINSYSFSNCTNLKQVKTNETTKLVEIHKGSFENTQIEELLINRKATVLFEATRVPKLNKIQFSKGKPENFVQLEDGTIFDKNCNVEYEDASYEDITNLITKSYHHPETEYSKESKNYLINLYKEKEGEFVNLIFAPKNLQVLKIVNNCLSIGKGILDDMNNLTKIEYIEGPINYVMNFPCYNRLTTGKSNKLSEIKIMGSSAVLQENVFSYFSSLEIIDFGDKTNLLYIPKNAFLGCENLRKIRIPASCYSIDEGAFKNCTKLEEVEIGIKGSKRSLKYIKKDAFLNCSSLQSIIIPSSVTIIYENAFMNCIKLEKVKINDELDGKKGIKLIQKNAFKNCTSLSSFNLPKSCFFIGPCCFMNCTSLQSFKYEGPNLKYIPCRSFYNCSSLTKFEMKYPQIEEDDDNNNEEEQEFEENNYYNNYGEISDENNPLYYIKNSKQDDQIRKFSIMQEAFMNCSKLEEIVIEDQYKNDKNEFYDANKKEIIRKTFFSEIPQYIGKRAFANCSSLKKAQFFLVKLQIFDEFCFENCSNLVEIDTNTLLYHLLMNQNLRRNAFVNANEKLEVKFFNEGKVTDITSKVDVKNKRLLEKRHFKQQFVLNRDFLSSEIKQGKNENETKAVIGYNVLFYSIEKRDPPPEKQKQEQEPAKEQQEQVQEQEQKVDEVVPVNNEKVMESNNNNNQKTEYKIDKIQRKRHYKEYLSSLNKLFLTWNVPQLNQTLKSKKKKAHRTNFHHQKSDLYGIFIDNQMITPGPASYDIIPYSVRPISIHIRYHQTPESTCTEYNYDIPELKPPLNI